MDRFSEIIDGSLSLSTFIEQDWATAGYPDESSKRKSAGKGGSKKRKKSDSNAEDGAESSGDEGVPIPKILKLNLKMNQLLSDLRNEEVPFSVERYRSVSRLHQTALDALFFLQAKSKESNVLSSHFQFLTSYINVMQLFQKGATNEVEFNQMEIEESKEDMTTLQAAHDKLKASTEETNNASDDQENNQENPAVDLSQEGSE